MRFTRRSHAIANHKEPDIDVSPKTPSTRSAILRHDLVDEPFVTGDDPL
jgi:hypothetical protein